MITVGPEWENTRITLRLEELSILNNVLNEVCNGITVRQPAGKVEAASRMMASKLLQRFSSVIPKMESLGQSSEPGYWRRFCKTLISMAKFPSDSRHICLSLEELSTLNAAFEDVCSEIEDFEFDTRIGADRKEVAELLRKVHLLVDKGSVVCPDTGR